MTKVKKGTLEYDKQSLISDLEDFGWTESEVIEFVKSKKWSKREWYLFILAKSEQDFTEAFEVSKSYSDYERLLIADVYFIMQSIRKRDLR